MGKLINGEWKTTDVRKDGDTDDGSFKRSAVRFRKKVEAGGEHPPESGRYHLYVSYACPWAHRTLITRKLMGLESVISVSSVSPIMLEDGWTFKNDHDDLAKDDLFGEKFLRDIYLRADSHYTGKVTVPVLWDKKAETIVNNESADIIRIFMEAFSEYSDFEGDLVPDRLESDIEKWNKKIYEKVNNGVYRTGFSRTQAAYEEAYESLFNALDEVDNHIDKNKYFFGDSLTETDIRLFPTLIRFDPVYYVHFKCNGRLISQYQSLSRYLQGLLEIEAFSDTTKVEHFKKHYYYSHKEINPSQLIPRGPRQ